VARNRKRAKARQARRPQPVAATRPEREEAPAPIVHATPDVEIAEAQLAVGRPEPEDPGEEPVAEAEPVVEGEVEGEQDLEEFEEEPGAAGEPSRARHDGEGATALPARRAAPGGRLASFLQGSWRELQRVQWPDRRQVMQATGVVIGFVIIAGVFLGIADWGAGKVMNYILTGHFK
jgi:preprotein translocase subunit SecE